MTTEDSPPPLLRPTNLVALLGAAALPVAVAPLLPIAHWLVDLPASFCLQAGAALLLATLVLAANRRWRLSSVLGTGLAGFAFAVVPGQLASADLAATGSHPFTVLTLNLARGNEANAAGALAEIERLQPDVLCLSEMTPAWRAAIEPGLAAFPHRRVRVDPGWFGIALYSRHPLATAEVIPLGFDWAPAIRAVAVTPGGALGVLAVHAPRPGVGNRCAERDAALRAIAVAVKPLPQRRVVLGDFNSTPWNREFPAMLAATGLHHANGCGLQPTWPVQALWPLRIPIDHVLVGAGIGVERVEVGRDFGSDHAPLMAVLRW